jgi:NADPH-dependent 2,4-dienoyl-CoA reductase/sulfur reductase-like enzyme
MKVVIVGGVAAGPKAASKIIRLNPEADVTIVEKDKFLSYAGCGLPYYISGEVKEQKELMCTPVGVVRDPVFFRKVKNVHVLTETAAKEIDRTGKRLRVQKLTDQQEQWLDYDKLVLATGADPIMPPLPGHDLENIFTLHGVHDAEAIKALLAEDKAWDVVIIGGGLIGIEITEALTHKGCRVTIVEKFPQIFRMLDWEMAKLVALHMETKGVKILTGTEVKAFKGQNKVKEVVTDKSTLPADVVIMSVGVRPQVQLAQAAGLDIGAWKAIKVNAQMQTSDPDIYAAGDCVECLDRITGKACYMPMGSTANKQGRVAANNICGHADAFPGVLGSTICKVFDYAVARTGLTESAAKEMGKEVVSVMAPAPDRAHFMSDAKPLLLKLVVDKENRKLLGAQATGPGDADKRMDVAAMALMSGWTVDQLANADLCYAPRYAPAM